MGLRYHRRVVRHQMRRNKSVTCHPGDPNISQWIPQSALLWLLVRSYGRGQLRTRVSGHGSRDPGVVPAWLVARQALISWVSP